MRNTRKIFVALVLVLAMMMSVATLFASAADQPETLYLTPNANWKQSNARFAAYFFGNGDTWVSMTDADGDGVYEVKVPTDKVYPNVIFCRMNPSASANNWNNKWNQTADLTIPTSGANHYTVKEGTWDSGGGNWSTYGSTCLHTNLSAEATCTTAQTCLDCGDPVVSALGHSFDSAHLCTRCGEQASFTVAGSGAHLGTEWDTGNTANDMTYADGTYTKVYTNVAAGSYEFKVVRDHGWGTAYPSANKTYTVATTGSTVTITLKGTTVNVVVEAPHVHSYAYPCDPVCQECYEISNPDAKHDVVHVEANAATCYEDGNVEYWYCSYCGTAWTDEALTQLTNLKNVVTPMGHAPATHVEAVPPTCYEDGNIEYWYCEDCGQAWLDEACTLNTNLLAVVLPMAHGEATHVAAKAPTCYENGNIEYWYCEDCGQAWLDEACTLNTNLLAVVLPMAHGEATHVEAKAPTCYENGNIEYWLCEACGQAWLDEACTLNTNLLAVVLPMAHVEATHVEAKAPTCTELGNIEYWYCAECGQAWLDEACTQNTNLQAVKLPTADHSFAEGKCSVCGAEDPDYEAPATNDKLINFSTWEPFAKETYADGDVLKLNDIFTFIMSKNSRVDSSSKTWDDFSGTLRFSFGGKTPTGSVPAKNALQITVDGAYTLKIWYVAGGDNRYFALMDSTGAILSSTTTETVKNGQYYAELEIPAAGVYYFGVPADNNYIFQLELVKKEVAPHVHSYAYPCDKACQECGEISNPDAAHTIVHVDAVAATCYVDGNIEHWYCSDCGYAWADEALTQQTNLKSVIVPMAHGEAKHVEAKAPTCYENGNLEYWLCEACGQAWLDEACTQNTNVLAVVLPAAHDYVNGKCSACGAEDPDYVPHVNTLVVGDTNKIVVSGDFVNDFGSPIEWVPFVADENAFYSFVGDNGALAFIFDANAALVSATGAANLEAGNYLICLGNGAVGEFNVAVTKSAWVNAFVEGANKIYVDDSINNGANYYVAVVPFEVTEAAKYAFTSTNGLALIYDAAVNNLCGFTGAAELQPGTYYIWVSAYTELTTGVIDITLTKTAIGGGDVVEPEYPALNLGDNTVVIDGSVTNITGQPIAWLEFVVAEDGIYAITSADLNCYISADATFNNILCGWTGTAELTAGTYYVAVGNSGITGEFTVKAEKLGDDVELPAVNTLVLGDNVYVLNQALKDIGYEFLYFTADKDGIYTFAGIDDLIFFIWPDYPNQATVPDTASYVWNIDPVTADLLDSVEVELTAGTYLVGFKTVTPDGSVNTPVGEYPISVTYAEKVEQPDPEQPDPEQPDPEQPGGDEPQEEPELTLFQKILKAITDFFAKIGEFFKNLFKKQ